MGFSKRHKEIPDKENRFLGVSARTNFFILLIFTALALLCLVPLIFVAIISLSSEQSINENGFRFIPAEWTTEAYRYVAANGGLFEAFVNSIVVTLTGTVLGLVLTTTFAYVLTRKEYRFGRFLTYVMLITMMFNGGMVARYMLVTRVLGWKNSLLALIVPGAVSAFNIIVLRTFIKTSVPDEIIESARIDGANEFLTFFKIVLPISVPGIATVGLFLTLQYWNQWMPSMLYTDKRSLYTLQYFLMQIERNMQYLSQNADALGVSLLQNAANLPTESAKMAIVIISTLPIACAYPFFQRYFVSGLTIGAVKG